MDALSEASSNKQLSSLKKIIIMNGTRHTYLRYDIYVTTLFLNAILSLLSFLCVRECACVHVQVVSMLSWLELGLLPLVCLPVECKNV